MKTLVVANPASSAGRVGRRWPEVESILRQALGSLTVRFTEAPSHATRIVREALSDGIDRIVAVGGDGTFSEVTDGYFDGERPIRPAASLGLVPAGTGGDFRKTLGIPRKLGEAAARIRDAQPRAIDVGRLRYRDHDGREAMRHFLNIASFGIGGLVDDIVNHSSKALGGKAAFYLGTLRALLRYQNQRVRISLEGGEPREARVLNVAVANGRFFGGGMQIAPRALLDDGLFDVVELGDLGLADFLLRGQRVRRGEHLDMENVQFTRARRVEALPALGERVLLDVDGEQPGMLPASFEIVPRALSILC